MTRMHCTRRRLDCSVEDCLTDYRRVQAGGARSDRSEWHCRRCPEGAERAGQDWALLQKQQGIEQSVRICARCHRPAGRYIHGRLCPSCDARDREMQCGRNGKGSYPTELMARWRPHPETVRVFLGTDWQVKVMVHTSGPVETLLSLTRTLRNPEVLFSRVVLHDADTPD